MEAAVFPVVGYSVLTNSDLPPACYVKIRPRYEGENLYYGRKSYVRCDRSGKPRAR